MKSKKDQASKIIAFILILLGFIASVGIGITGTVMKIKEFIDEQKPEEIFIHPFFDEGKLWFYNNSQEIVSSYTCTAGTPYCGFAYEFIDDEAYSLQYYFDGSINKIETINGVYAFLVDAPKIESAEGSSSSGVNYYRDVPIKLYDIKSGKVLYEYSAIKNYSMLPDRTFIVRALDGKWGVIQFVGAEMNQIVDFKYDYIGVFAANKDLAPIDYKYYVALKDGKWLMLDNTGNEVSTPISEPIYGHEGTAMVIKIDNNAYDIYNSSGQKVDPIHFEGVFYTEKGYLIAYRKGNKAIITDDTGKILKDVVLSTQRPSYKYDENTNEVVVTLEGSEIFREKAKGLEEEETPAPQVTN